MLTKSRDMCEWLGFMLGVPRDMCEWLGFMLGVPRDMCEWLGFGSPRVSCEQLVIACKSLQASKLLLKNYVVLSYFL